MALWVIQSKQNFVWKNWPFLAALAGPNFQVQFLMPYSIRIQEVHFRKVGDNLKCYGYGYDFHKES